MKFLKLLALMATVVLLGTGCGNVQKQLNTVVVFEQSAQGYVQQLSMAATAAISALPADQQAAMYAKVSDLMDKLTATLAAKDKALQDAIAANSANGFDFGKLTQDVLEAVQAIVALVEVIGNDASKAKAKAAGAALTEHHVKLKAVLAQ